MAKKNSTAVTASELASAIHAYLVEAAPGHVPSPPALASDLDALADAAGAPLTPEVRAFFLAADGIALPVEVPDLPTLLTVREAIEETRKAREAGAPPLVVLTYQDYESAVPAVLLTGENADHVVDWESVEGHTEEDDARPLAKYLASYLKTLERALPTPKKLAAAVARIAKEARAGNPVHEQFERFAHPAKLLQAVLEHAPDATSWIVERYKDHALDHPLRRYGKALPRELLMATLSKLRFAGTTTILEGYLPLIDAILAYAYVWDPETMVRLAEQLEGPAKDGWLLMRRRMGLVGVDAIPEELRVRLAASPRNYRVLTPVNGTITEATAAGIDGLLPYFASRDDVIAALKKAPARAATSPEVALLVLGDAPTVDRIVEVANASFEHVGVLDDVVWHRLPFASLVAAAKGVGGGDWLAWVCLGHPGATPDALNELTDVFAMPADPDDLARLPPSIAKAVQARSEAH